MPYMKSAFKS